MKPSKSILLVEGTDDREVIFQLLNHYGLGDVTKSKQIVVEVAKGVSNILDVALAEIENNMTLETMGLVMDADSSVMNRWDSIKSKLDSFKAVPVTPENNGTIFTVTRLNLSEITVGVWIMPNNQSPGMLEDFIQSLVPDHDNLWQRAQNCVAQIPAVELPFDTTQKTVDGMVAWSTKATLHTWLAWQDEPGKPMGLAITKKFLNAKSPHAQTLMQWLRRLFNL